MGWYEVSIGIKKIKKQGADRPLRVPFFPSNFFGDRKYFPTQFSVNEKKNHSTV